MLYIDFWNSYWKNVAEISGPGPDPNDAISLPPIVERRRDQFVPKQKYEYLTEYGTQILCLFKEAVGCDYLSRNFETITGNSSDQCLGDNFYDIVHPDSQDRLRRILSSDSPSEKPTNVRCRLRHGDQSWQWYMFLIHSKRNGEGMEHVCIVENINDSVQAQSILQKAKLEAELALRARSEFLANMSHDLRTPLNAVIGFSQIIESGIFGKMENPQYAEYIKHIQESGYDLLSKIEDLLEISNIDAGRVGLDKEEVYLSEIIKHVMGAQIHHASSAKVTLEQRLLQGDVLLHVDRLKLQHILGHLLSNAIRFSQKNGKVILESAMTDDDGLLLRIRDNGCGIPKAKLSDIMAALKEDNCWTAKNSHGIGLGLALTKEFVTLHGGNIKIISKEGTGTTVYITLPRECLPMVRIHEAQFEHQTTD